MKQKQLVKIPQKEFGFAPNMFNLFQESTADGEKIASEQEQSALARQRAEKAQRRLFKGRKKQHRRSYGFALFYCKSRR